MRPMPLSSRRIFLDLNEKFYPLRSLPVPNMTYAR